MTRYCMALDLKDDPKLIEEYKKYHAPGGVWPEIVKGIKDAGIEDMQIYLIKNRLFMVMEAKDTFSFEAMAESDANNPKVQEWYELMRRFQQALPWSSADGSWELMDNIFELHKQ